MKKSKSKRKNAIVGSDIVFDQDPPKFTLPEVSHAGEEFVRMRTLNMCDLVERLRMEGRIPSLSLEVTVNMMGLMADIVRNLIAVKFRNGIKELSLKIKDTSIEVATMEPECHGLENGVSFNVLDGLGLDPWGSNVSVSLSKNKRKLVIDIDPHMPAEVGQH